MHACAIDCNIIETVENHNYVYDLALHHMQMRGRSPYGTYVCVWKIHAVYVYVICTFACAHAHTHTHIYVHIVHFRLHVHASYHLYRDNTSIKYAVLAVMLLTSQQQHDMDHMHAGVSGPLLSRD